jgi:hypothetical protein
MHTLSASLRGLAALRRLLLVTAGLAAVLLACIAGFAPPARALAPGDETLEPPGLEDRETHMTMLTTHESDCTELAIVRAVTAAGARALVPERYQPAAVVSGDLVSGRFQMWDYVCEHLRLDDQSHAPRTQISIGAIAVTSRGGVPVNRGYYLVYLATDNPALAARYRQVGLPAAFTPGLSAAVSDVAASPFEVSFIAPTAQYTLTAVSAMAPSPVPVAADGPNLFYEGGSGEVLLSYHNHTGAAVSAGVTADYRQHEILAPIIALPRLLQPAGVPFPLIRGDWDATVARLD